MKKIISILSVSLFAVVFAAGCAKDEKHKECSAAKTEKACTTESNFEPAAKCVFKYTTASDATDANKDVKDKGTCVKQGEDKADVETACKVPKVVAGTPAVATACADAIKHFKNTKHTCVNKPTQSTTANDPVCDFTEVK